MTALQPRQQPILIFGQFQRGRNLIDRYKTGGLYKIEGTEQKPTTRNENGRYRSSTLTFFLFNVRLLGRPSESVTSKLPPNARIS